MKVESGSSGLGYGLAAGFCEEGTCTSRQKQECFSSNLTIMKYV
jgi:hypothetical protein